MKKPQLQCIYIKPLIYTTPTIHDTIFPNKPDITYSL